MERNATIASIYLLIGATVVMVGFSSAILICMSGSEQEEVLGYDADGGSIYPIKPDDSGKYLRDLEMYGGKANVLMDEFRRWFIELWQGKRLALMVALISILVSTCFFRAARDRGNQPSMDRGGPPETG